VPRAFPLRPRDIMLPRPAAQTQFFDEVHVRRYSAKHKLPSFSLETWIWPNRVIQTLYPSSCKEQTSFSDFSLPAVPSPNGRNGPLSPWPSYYRHARNYAVAGSFPAWHPDTIPTPKRKRGEGPRSGHRLRLRLGKRQRHNDLTANSGDARFGFFPTPPTCVIVTFAGAQLFSWFKCQARLCQAPSRQRYNRDS
jgi:hypothetical protein